MFIYQKTYKNKEISIFLGKICARCNIKGPYCIYNAHEQLKTFGTKTIETWQ